MLENVFSWSKSRDEQFRECQRKYFYDKYASWGGWDRNAPSRARMAYVLKNLKNRWAWKGETVHHVIENVLKAARQKSPLTFEEALRQLTEIMRRDYKNSKSKKYLEEPKKTLGLFEHEYQKPVTDETWKKIHDESASCLQNFYGCELYQELLRDDPTRWLVIEDLEEYVLEGSKIFVKLDFARKKDDMVEIYDWKTGKTNGDTDVQMGTYAVYATQKWGVPLEKIRAFVVNLTSPFPRAEACPVTRELVDSTTSFIRESVRQMQSLLSDPARNVPKPEENFQFTQNTRLCDSCNFYKICEKYQK
jgi:hypothetical protein